MATEAVPLSWTLTTFNLLDISSTRHDTLTKHTRAEMALEDNIKAEAIRFDIDYYNEHRLARRF